MKLRSISILLVACLLCTTAVAQESPKVKLRVIVFGAFDTHPNHHVISSLVWQCYRRQGGWNLYFFEVMTGEQTLGFHPELYLDIEKVRSLKKEACYCHAGEQPDGFWAVHEAMHRRRGAESGVESAEAYTLSEPKPGCSTLPLEFLNEHH